MGRKGGRRGSQAIDEAGLRELGRDRRMWIKRGRVKKFEGETSHADQSAQDVLIDVELQPSGEPVLCRLGAAAGGVGWGIWAIPGEGTEVEVGIPDGELEMDPVILRILSSGQVPDGLTPQRIIIVAPAGGEVLVHDGTANQAVPLAKRSELQAVVDIFNDHVHYAGGAITDKPSTVPQIPPNPSPPPDYLPPIGYSTAPSPAGTSVLKGK